MGKENSTKKASLYYYEKLYIQGRFDDVRKALYSIACGRRLPRVYIILLSEKDDELFEIIESGSTLELLLYGRRGLVVGLARGRDGARELIRRMVAERAEDVYGIKSYWQSRSYLPLERMSL